MTDIQFHIASSNDWEKFRDLRLFGLATDPQAFGGNFANESERDETEWRKRLGAFDRFFFIAEKEGIFVAVAGAKQVGPTRWMLIAVYTKPEFRGQGLAQKLTNFVLIETKNRSGEIVELMVNVDQKDAVRVYEKTGFKIVKTLKDEKMGDGKLHDEYQMEKTLSD
ncbi:MAG TPA: GNAT family N-acetyltransferase [Candidatus Paceibacterota bacterium]|jgi:Predicted acetyltransferase